MEIEWKFERLDEGEAEDHLRPDCLLEITGRIGADGEEAGMVKGFYIFADRLDSAGAFWELWDVDARACEVFIEIHSPNRKGLREPLGRLLSDAPGLLCLESIVLLPEFRKRGLGREVMRATVRSCADERIGAILLKAEPLQYEAEQPDLLEPEIDPGLMGLPQDDRKRDREKLRNHFRTWGMQRLPQTSYMVAARNTLCEEPAHSWPPCVIQNLENTCTVCGGVIEFMKEEWDEGPEGLIHARCQ